MNWSAPLLLSLIGAAPLHAAIEPTGCDSSWLAQPRSQSFNYPTDIQPIWEQFCANCHVAHAGSPAAGLDLDPKFSYTNLVGAPDGSLSIFLVDPYNPIDSLLFRKLNCEQPGPQSGSGRMPLGRVPLGAQLQARIYDWIAAGAPLQLERLFVSGMEQR